MTSPEIDQRLSPRRVAELTGLSEKTVRRALLDAADPLPFQRVGLGDPAHARILIRRRDLEAWLARRHAALSTSTRDVVDEIVERVLGGAV